jgi:hypothetical protein
MLYVSATVASPGNVEFKIEHSPGSATAGTFYELGTGGETPEIFGPIAFTGADDKSLVVPGLLPNEQIQVYFRASANATSAKLGIIGLSYQDDSGIVNTDVSVGDIEVDAAAMEVLLTTISLAVGTPGAGYQTYSDTSFVTGDSPVVHDINADLGRNGNKGYFVNDGAGDISLKISQSGAVSTEDAIVIENGEVFSLDGLNADQIQVTWVADSAYRIFVA